MDGISNSNNTNIQRSAAQQSAPLDSGLKIEAHYTNNMKVKRPSIDPNSINFVVPENKKLTDKEMNKRILDLNTDIYEAHKKEASNREFNFRTYFKIIAGFIIAAASIAGIRKIFNFFRR